METEFTPFASLLGGGIIGLSAVVLLATQGRIAGIVASCHAYCRHQSIKPDCHKGSYF